MVKYGILFTGPVRQSVWWMSDGPYGIKRMTFTDINDAHQWSDTSTRMYPHCKYLVMEIPDEEDPKKAAPKSRRNTSQKSQGWTT